MWILSECPNCLVSNQAAASGSSMKAHRGITH